MKLFKPRIEIDQQGRKVYTLSLRFANRFTLILLPVLVGICLPPFYWLYGMPRYSVPANPTLLFYLLFVILGVVIHELLHGLVWALYARGGFRAISFGIKWSALTPYCHCRESLKVWQYKAGTLAPLLVMGILPLILAFFVGSGLFLYLGIFFTLAAGGDILSVWMLRGFNRNNVVYDHPEEMGYIIEQEQE